jgi:hypothetical protein
VAWTCTGKYKGALIDCKITTLFFIDNTKTKVFFAKYSYKVDLLNNKIKETAIKPKFYRCFFV